VGPSEEDKEPEEEGGGGDPEAAAGEEGREGEQWEEDVEVEQAVEEVEGERLLAVEVRALAAGGEDVVEDDVERGEDGLAEEVAVDEEGGQADERAEHAGPFEEVAEAGRDRAVAEDHVESDRESWGDWEAVKCAVGVRGFVCK